MKDLRKMFGTDGIRGIANRDLTAELSIKIGRAASRFLTSKKKAKIIVGRDPRPSGDMLSKALIAGILSEGSDVLDAGILPTPSLALLIRLLETDGGIVITASHNPLEDNGIKLLAKGGKKLSDAQESSVEEFILEEEVNPDRLPLGNDLGRYIFLDDANKIYIDHLLKQFDLDLSGLKIVLDCANGASSILAPNILKLFNADVLSFNTDISGKEINRGCGSTHPELISKLVRDNMANIGFSYDGDGDRVIACDSKGRILDGDYILAFCARRLKSKGQLKNNCVITTIMANMGLDKFLEEENISIEKTGVGDRYVLERMQATGSVIGGEQSGHIIFSDISTAGDGIISTLEFLNSIIDTGYDFDNIFDILKKYPQIIKNVKVRDKDSLLHDKAIAGKIKEIEKGLGSEGRVVVRPSGTEPLVRIMVEAVNADKANSTVRDIYKIIRKYEKD